MKYEEFKEMTDLNLNRRLHRFKELIKSALFKCKVGVFELLAKLRIVEKVYVNDVKQISGKEPPSPRKLKTDRYEFDVSYIIDKVDFIYRYLFKTKKGKTLFVVADDFRSESRIRWRAELVSFYVHLSHREEMWVNRKSPEIFIPPRIDTFKGDNILGLAKRLRLDFNSCRYAFEYSFEDTIDIPIQEVIEKSYNVLKNGLNSKVVEMNERLTGVKNDGVLTTKEGQPIADNLLCKSCGFPVFMSNKDRYSFECINHGELNVNDCERVDPIKHREVVKYCLRALESFCESR